jgi:hypothetical protein
MERVTQLVQDDLISRSHLHLQTGWNFLTQGHEVFGGWEFWGTVNPIHSSFQKRLLVSPGLCLCPFLGLLSHSCPLSSCLGQG